MDSLLGHLTQYGALGIVCALLLYDVFYLQRKLIAIIDNNTRALSQLQTVVNECHNRAAMHRKTDQ